MDNKELAHLWANRSRQSANGSHFYFSGDTIYSYGSHFPIARHFRGVVLFTTAGYSSSTARHCSLARSACSHLTVFDVADPSKGPSGKDVENYAADILSLSESAAKARNPAAALESLERKINQANEFCQRFGFKNRFSLPDEKTLAALKERAKVSADRERKAKAAKQAKQEREALETVQKWLAGESVTIPHYIQTVYLRKIHKSTESINGSEDYQMQTSRGALVPMSEAEKAYRFARLMRSKGWHKNGEEFKVGDYHLDAVNENGIVAGCHRIT